MKRLLHRYSYLHTRLSTLLSTLPPSTLVVVFDTSLYFPYPITHSDREAAENGMIRFADAVSGGGIYIGYASAVSSLLSRLTPPSPSIMSLMEPMEMYRKRTGFMGIGGSYGVVSTFTNAGYPKSVPGGVVGDEENYCMRTVKIDKGK